MTCRPRGQVRVMNQSWRDLLFLHWTISPEDIQATLPPGLHVDTWNGNAYIGVVPFLMRNVRPNGLPPVKGLSDFPELNVRTYVVSDEGIPGVWFYTLDAGNWLAVQTAINLFHLPYRYADMRVNITFPESVPDRKCISYTSKKVSHPWSTQPPISEFEYSVEGDGVVQAGAGTLEYFLVERYVLFSWNPVARTLHSGRVWHTSYPLQSVQGLSIKCPILSECGFVEPDTPPVHAIYSPGVDVEIFPLMTVGQY